MNKLNIILFFVLLLFASCFRAEGKDDNDRSGAAKYKGSVEADGTGEKKELGVILERAGIPQELRQKILQADSGVFLAQLNEAISGDPYDPYLYILIDKQHPFSPESYTPQDLVSLENGRGYGIGRAGLKLRRSAEQALSEMALAARADGVTLVASSTYRSYEYQVEVYARNVKESGQETADRESARPGHSQHQLGLVVDFGSITDDYAKTPAGRWLLSNAGKYGWSLSFPDGYEALTGYRWECWHYRYVGKPLAAFIENWFGGIQVYGLIFIHNWEEYYKG